MITRRRLGDVLPTTPLIRALKLVFPAPPSPSVLVPAAIGFRTKMRKNSSYVSSAFIMGA